MTIVAIGALMGAPSADAIVRPEATAETSGEGVNLRFVRQSDGSVRARASREDSCEWHAQLLRAASDDSPDLPAAAYGEPPGPDFELYVIWCGSRTYLRWLGPRDFGESTEPIVEELVRRVTALPTGINVRPDTRGVTGITSFFWIEGYGGDTLRATETAFGLMVEVSAQLVGVEWNFGDGTPPAQAGLGEAWPERSSVQHTYRDASGETPYRVTANLVLQPSYTVNGISGDPLEPIVIPITRDYVVRQVQAIRRR